MAQWSDSKRNGLHSFERDGINKRITAMQNHSLGILTGLVCMLSRIIILVHVLVTRLWYRDLALHFL